MRPHHGLAAQDGGVVPKWLAGGVVLLVVLYIIAQPAHAASMANGAWGLAQTAGHHLSTFVSHLGS